MASKNGAGTVVEAFPVALDADALLAIDSLDTQTIPIPEWRVSVVIRPLTQAEAEEIALDCMIGDPQGGKQELDRRAWNRHMVARCLVNPAMDLEQVERLFSKSAHAVGKILKACMEINGQSTASGEEDGAARAAFPVELPKAPGV
jgi:hypothetical protein